MFKKGIVLVVALGFAGSSMAFEPADGDKKENTVVTQAREAKLGQCMATLEEISNFLIEDSKHGSHDFWGEDNSVNRHPFLSEIVKAYSDGDAQINLAVFPKSDGKCDWSYTETYIIETSCQAAREKSFKEFKSEGDLVGTTAVLASKSGDLNVYLTPSESGRNCLVTKREVMLAK